MTCSIYVAHLSLLQRNDFSTDHYEDFSATTSALKRVVWPAAAASGSVAATEQTEGRQRHRSSSQQRATKPSRAGAVDRPMEWIGQQQKERRGESAERIEREYEMEIQKKAWDAHHSESYYRMSR